MSLFPVPHRTRTAMIKYREQSTVRPQNPPWYRSIDESVLNISFSSVSDKLVERLQIDREWLEN